MEGCTSVKGSVGSSVLCLIPAVIPNMEASDLDCEPGCCSTGDWLGLLGSTFVMGCRPVREVWDSILLSVAILGAVAGACFFSGGGEPCIVREVSESEADKLGLSKLPSLGFVFLSTTCWNSWCESSWELLGGWSSLDEVDSWMSFRVSKLGVILGGGAGAFFFMDLSAIVEAKIEASVLEAATVCCCGCCCW